MVSLMASGIPAMTKTQPKDVRNTILEVKGRQEPITPGGSRGVGWTRGETGSSGSQGDICYRKRKWGRKRRSTPKQMILHGRQTDG